MNETTDILTDEDIDLINNFVEKPNLRLLIFTLLFTILSYFASIFLNTYIPLIVFGFFAGIAAAWYYYMRWKIVNYTSSGIKKIVQGRIDDKFEKSVEMKRSKNFASSTDTFGFIKINDKEYMIPFNDYQQVNAGDHVILNITNLDEIVFKVTKD
jgi:hypothetical protein